MPENQRPWTLPALCRRLIEANPQDWRARLALARHLSSRDSSPEALEILFEALVHNPHALALHQVIWHTLSTLDLSPALVTRYVDLTRDAVFYLDPHHPLPLSEHGAALAVPAVPRVEYVYRGEDCAGERKLEV